MTDATDPPLPVGDPPIRPGGRSARIREAVLEAALAELVTVGFEDMTVDAVAQRAGVHRATVYRRWRDVAGLLADVLVAARDDEWKPADTGTLEGDLIALNREITDAFTEQPSVSLAMVTAALRAPHAAAALRSFWADRYRRSAVVVGRAIERGEIPSDTDATRLLVAAAAPLYHRIILLRESASELDGEGVALDVAIAARAGAFRTSSHPGPG